MKIVISSDAYNEIESFYLNMHKKFRNSWGIEEIHSLIDDVVDSIYQIENGLQRRTPTISRWEGLFMATSQDRRWNFAYRIKGNTIYVEDACHAQNMHETRNIIRLTENQFKKFISNCVENVLKEVVEQDSYQAKPKKKGRLNDWEISNILHSIITDLISAKRITPEDGVASDKLCQGLILS